MDVNHLLQYLIPGIFLIIWVIGRIFNTKDSKTDSDGTVEGSGRAVNERVLRTYGSDTEEGKVGTKVRRKSRDSVVVGQEEIMMPTEGTKEADVFDKTLILGGMSEVEEKRRGLGLGNMFRGRDGLRKAVLNYEIFGPPLCLRKNGKIGRSWQR